MNTLTIIPAIILAGLAAGGYLGYEVGTRKLLAVQAQLADVRRTLDTENREYQRTRQQLVDTATQIEAQHRREQDRIKADYQSQVQHLKDSNDDAQRRIASLDAQISAIDRERRSIQQDRQPANGAAEAARLQVLDAERSANTAEIAGLACLQAAVPVAQIASFQHN
ncbi:hypothetical protein [Piscinibacter terrae]|uniref:hypothetical protein n=1 Tax=Piscinibacter terrae TaxID=2496871 RepID=UPI000F5A8564|nr:hypothetical protein [Albitalea terrae]